MILIKKWGENSLGYHPEEIQLCERFPDEEEIAFPEGFISLAEEEFIAFKKSLSTILEEWKLNPESIYFKEAWGKVRERRRLLLMESDWTQLWDSPTKDDPSWCQYRQQLRDIPQIFSTPYEVIFPSKPV